MIKPNETSTYYKIKMVKTVYSEEVPAELQTYAFKLVNLKDGTEFPLSTFSYNEAIHKKNIVLTYDHNQHLAIDSFTKTIQLDLYQYFLESLKQAIDNFDVTEFLNLDGSVK